MRAAPALALIAALIGCGGSQAPAPSSAPPSPADGPDGSPSPGAVLTAADRAPGGPKPVRARLQGTWEIVRYTSEHRIPDDAMPLMGMMFDQLRLRFEGGRFIAGTSPATEESTELAIGGERGDEFTIIAKGGLFDGARCRFVDADTWEAQDHGPTWPGVSVLRRVAGGGGKAGSPAPAPGKPGRPGR